MELRHLRYFLAVAERGSFTSAAEHLGLSQPPLSRQIQQLEAEIGTALFERGRHGARLTAAGQELHDRATRILRQVDAAVEETRAHGRGAQGRIRVGYSAAAASLLVPAIRALRERGLGVEIHLDEMTAQVQYRALVAGQLDVGLGYRIPAIDATGISSAPLRRSRVRIAIAGAWRRQVRRNAGWLAAHPLLFLPASSAPALHAQVLQALRTAGIVPATVRSFASVRSVGLLIQAREGFGVMPETIVEQLPGVYAVEHLPLDIELSTWAFWVTSTEASRAFIDALIAAGGAP